MTSGRASPADWTPARRLEIVLEVLRGDASVEAAARRHGLPEETVADWVSRGLAGAESALAPDTPEAAGNRPPSTAAPLPPAGSPEPPLRRRWSGKTAAALAPELFGPAPAEAAALPGPPAPRSAGPPDRIAEAVRSFNARHSALFETVRAEMGAGTRNFVAACVRSLPAEFAAAFEGVPVGSRGEWDPGALAGRLMERDAAVPAAEARGGAERALEELLRVELRLARRLLPPAAYDGLSGRVAPD